MVSASHYFIGVPITDEIRVLLRDWQTELASSIRFKTWTHPEDMHITLKFLGAASEESIEEVIEKLKQAPFPSAFPVDVSNLSYFGKAERPRVIFMEVQKQESLLQIQETVEEIASSSGFPVENRPYHPHITLGKKWQAGQEGVFSVELLESYQKRMVLEVDKFHVYRIHPSKQPKYEIIATIELR